MPSPFSLSPTTLLPSGNHHFVLCIYESVSVLFVHLFCSLDPAYKWNQKVFVSLCLIILSILPSRLIHIVANGKISFLKRFYLFLERGKEGRKETNINVREKHWSIASHMQPNQGSNLPPRDRTYDLLLCRMMPNQLSHTSQRKISLFLWPSNIPLCIYVPQLVGFFFFQILTWRYVWF